MPPDLRGNRRLLDHLASATTGTPAADPPTHDPSIIRIPIAGNLLDHFTARAEAAGMHPAHTTEARLLDAIRTLWHQTTSGPALLEPALDCTRPNLRAQLGNCLADPTEDELFAADLAIVSAQAAIAETGSLVRPAAPDRPRSYALVPMTIIVVLHASQIVADLYDFLAAQTPAHMPSEIVLITGPSKSSDIGMQLVTGVHGPGVVHILIVTEA